MHNFCGVLRGCSERASIVTVPCESVDKTVEWKLVYRVTCASTVDCCLSVYLSCCCTDKNLVNEQYGVTPGVPLADGMRPVLTAVDNNNCNVPTVGFMYSRGLCSMSYLRCDCLPTYACWLLAEFNLYATSSNVSACPTHSLAYHRTTGSHLIS